MVGIEPLIRSVVPNPVYSETFSELAVIPGYGANTLQVKHDFRDRGAKAIIIHSIVCSVPTTGVVATNLCIVKDNFNKILLKFYQHSSFNGMYALNHVIIASGINLQFVGQNNTTSVTSLLITVQWQYVYNTESKPLKIQ